MGEYTKNATLCLFCNLPYIDANVVLPMVQIASSHILTADHIRSARALLDVSQKQLAAAAGISTATLNNIERQSNLPRERTLQAISEVLAKNGVSFQENDELEEMILHFRRASRPQQLANESPVGLLLDSALLPVERILLYAYTASSPAEGTEQESATGTGERRMGMLIINSARRILYDWVSFSLSTNVQAASFARLMMLLYRHHADKLFYLPEAQPSTTPMGLGEAMRFLLQQKYLPLRHVVHLCVLLGPMQTHIEPWIRDSSHPMRALMVMLDSNNLPHPGRSNPESAPPAETPSTPAPVQAIPDSPTPETAHVPEKPTESEAPVEPAPDSQIEQSPAKDPFAIW